MSIMLEPQQHFEVACCSGIANVAVVLVSCIFGVSHGGLRRVFINEHAQHGLNLNSNSINRFNGQSVDPSVIAKKWKCRMARGRTDVWRTIEQLRTHV